MLGRIRNLRILKEINIEEINNTIENKQPQWLGSSQ